MFEIGSIIKYKKKEYVINNVLDSKIYILHEEKTVVDEEERNALKWISLSEKQLNKKEVVGKVHNYIQSFEQGIEYNVCLKDTEIRALFSFLYNKKDYIAKDLEAARDALYRSLVSQSEEEPKMVSFFEINRRFNSRDVFSTNKFLDLWFFKVKYRPLCVTQIQIGDNCYDSFDGDPQVRNIRILKDINGDSWITFDKMKELPIGYVSIKYTIDFYYMNLKSLRIKNKMIKDIKE